MWSKCTSINTCKGLLLIKRPTGAHLHDWNDAWSKLSLFKSQKHLLTPSQQGQATAPVWTSMRSQSGSRWRESVPSLDGSNVSWLWSNQPRAQCELLGMAAKLSNCACISRTYTLTHARSPWTLRNASFPCVLSDIVWHAAAMMPRLLAHVVSCWGANVLFFFKFYLALIWRHPLMQLWGFLCEEMKQDATFCVFTLTIAVE